MIMASLSGNKRVFRWAIKSACMWAILMANPQANAEEANRIRDALSGALGATLCAESATLAGWCAALGTEAAYWIDRGLSLAIDRHFETRDQKFADSHQITICYPDGHCIRPRNQ
jgi:hypothetical protein